MDFNKLVFPAPNCSYCPSSLPGLLWIPRTRFFSMKSLVKSIDKFENCCSDTRRSSKPETNTKPGQVYIPCHYQNYTGEAHNRLILFFHGNAEDIGYASSFTRKLSVGLKADVLAVEYPGYGVYEGSTNAKAICEDAEIVFDFLTAEIGIKPENIIVFGRSIGSGPATHLAANRKPGALVLMSAYTSIKSVVKDIAGHLVSSLVAERFNNVQEIEKTECPCLFIHGKKDKIIPWEHSRMLYDKCRTYAAINISDSMSHNTFKLSSDIVNPVRKFLKQIMFKSNREKIVFPDYVLKTPEKKFVARNRDFVGRLFDNIIDES